MLEETVSKFTRYVGNDGRITVPYEVKAALRINAGDLVEVTIRKMNSPNSQTDDPSVPRHVARKKRKEKEK